MVCVAGLVPALFFFNDTATTEIYTLSLHDALPISSSSFTRATTRSASPRLKRLPVSFSCSSSKPLPAVSRKRTGGASTLARSEEHTSELQSRQYLVCRLLLEKKKIQHTYHHAEPPP